jgi:hypothetical protein
MDINTYKQQLNALGYGAAVVGSPPNPNAPAALRATVDASGNLLLNGKADLGLTTALRLFQHTHALPNNGQMGAATAAALTAAYAAKEMATDATVANQNAIAAGGAGSQFVDATTAGTVFDASGNVVGGSVVDPNDPEAEGNATIAAAQAAQVAGLAAGSVPGGSTSMQPTDTSLTGLTVPRPPAGMSMGAKFGIGIGGVVLLGGLALVATKYKKQ